MLADGSSRSGICGGIGGVGGRCFGGGAVQERGIFWDIFKIDLDEPSFGDCAGGEGLRIRGGGYEGGPPFDCGFEVRIGGGRHGGG